MLMRIADHIDNGSSDIRDWFLSSHDLVLDMLVDEQHREKMMDQRTDESRALERSGYVQLHAFTKSSINCQL